jgi:hypothetical protein
MASSCSFPVACVQKCDISLSIGVDGNFLIWNAAPINASASQPVHVHVEEILPGDLGKMDALEWYHL